MFAAAEWDLALRSIAIAEMLLVTTVLVRDQRSTTFGKFAFAVSFWITACLIPASTIDYYLPSGATLVLHVLLDLGPVVFWAFVGFIYIVRFRLTKTHYTIIIALTIASGIGHANAGTVPESISSLALAATMSTQAWFLVSSVRIVNSGTNDDLVQSRREIRLIIATSVITIGFVTLGHSIGATVGLMPTAVEIGALAAVAIIIAAFIVLIFQFDREKIFFSEANEQIPKGKFERLLVATTEENRELIDRLNQLMNEQHFYLKSGLTLEDMAKAMELGEHQLRRLINNELGYRNFSSFLNRYRIERACDQLRDLDLSRTPFQTIAMDLGFSSIGPFNRAFKAVTGTTPTEYRRDSLKMEAAAFENDR